MKFLFGPQGPPGWLVTGGMAGIALAYVFFAFFPAQKAMKSMRQELRDKQAYITTTDQLFATATAANTQLEQASTLVRKWQQEAPGAQQADRLPSLISDKAHQVGVRILRLEPQLSRPNGLIVEYPISISAEGTFEGIFNFVHGVEELPQTIWLRDVKVQRAGDLGGSLRCDLTLTIFGDLAENVD